MEVEPITYVSNCEKTSCVYSHHPIVLQIEREIIETFDNMLNDLELNYYFLKLVPFTPMNSICIQYLNINGVVCEARVKCGYSIQDTLKESRFPVVYYRVIEEFIFDCENYVSYCYPDLDSLNSTIATKFKLKLKKS